MDTTARLKALSENILLVDTDPTLIQAIAEQSQPCQLNPGETIYQQEEEVSGIYFILDGEVEIFSRYEGDEYLLSHAEKNHVFGEFLQVGISRRTTSARATKEISLLFLPIDQFLLLQQRFAKLVSEISHRLTRRLLWNQTNLALRMSNLFRGIEEHIVRRLINEMEILSIASNTILIPKGSIPLELYIVVHGCFQINRLNEVGKSQEIGRLARGETIGEKGVICSSPRSSEVRAVRDSSVACLHRDSYEGILRDYPLEINRTFVKSLLSSYDTGKAKKRKSTEVFTLVPISVDIKIDDIRDRLAMALSKFGRCEVIDSHVVNRAFSMQDAAQVSFTDEMNEAILQWLSEQEVSATFILNVVDPELSNWTRRALRQSDHILMVANAEESPVVGPFERQINIEIEGFSRKRTLILIHDDSVRVAQGSHQWLEPRFVDNHHHLRMNQKWDYQRVARFLTGNAIGLVLGGGGARGFAHIGVLQAFRELNIPIDMIGGNSMGAIIAAQFAMQATEEEMLEATLAFCKAGEQMTLPVLSLFSGKRMTGGLKKIFGSVQIEDLWHHFFSISCNISRATIETHSDGPLHQAVQNSNSAPGLLPPQVYKGDLLVDGALLNNIPVDVMKRKNRDGIIIAVDVNVREELLNNTAIEGDISGWRLIRNRLNPFEKRLNLPGIVDILGRASIIGGLAKRQRNKKGLADLYIEPPVQNFSIIGYSQGAEISRAGYRYAYGILKEWRSEQSLFGD